jgi:CDP-diacylglycerol--serine O-phosphatidyltransferase
MRITRAVVPSLFTVLNMFSGFMSLLHASRGEFIAASWFIILAAGFDALDGVMARITKSSSEFGVEIDSLSDVVSFGAAPAFLVYQLSLFRLEGLGILISSLLMIFAALRLARFNVQLVGFDKDHFVGLPVPASAITVASFTLSAWNDITGLTVVLSLLMVSKIPYDTLPRFSRRAMKREPWKFVFFVCGVVVVFATAGGAIFPLLLLFITLGIVRYVVTLIRRIVQGPAKFEDDEEVVEPSSIES